MRRFSLTPWSNAAKRQSRVSRGSPRQAERSARNRFVPRLESLEDRTVPSYVFSTLDDPNAGTMPGQGTGAFGINAHGQIVGNYSDSNVEFHGFLLSAGQYTTIDDPNADPFGTQGAFGINTRGQIVGMYTDNMNPLLIHGYLFNDGHYTTLDDPNATALPAEPQGTAAWGINERGQIVGYYYDSHATIHGFLLSGGQYTTLDAANAGTGFSQGTEALGINASGQIVGQYIDATYGSHGFLLSNGQYTTLDDPNSANFTVAAGINERGQIVGYYVDAVNAHGFLLSGGQYTTLDDPNAGTFGFTEASAINSSGKIVGFCADSNGFQHGFLATPDGGHAPASGGHGSGGLGDIHTGETTTGGMVQRTIVSDGAQTAFGKPGQDLGSRIELFFAARFTAGKHANITGTDLSPNNDEFPLAD